MGFWKKDNLLVEVFSQNPAIWGIVAGIVLLVWVIVDKPIRIGKIELPAIENKLARYMLGVIASAIILVSVVLSLAEPRALIPWRRPARAKLTVLTGLAAEELKIFNEVVKNFEKKHRLAVEVENVRWQETLSRLERNEAIDLITFDINAPRRELVDKGLIEDLSKRKGLIPATVHPALWEHVKVRGKTYFIPYRPNVRLVFLNKGKFKQLNKEKYQDLEIDHPNLPTTWAEVMEVARRFHYRDGQPRVVIEATNTDAPLLLLELIRSAGGDPINLLSPESRKAVEFLRELWPYVSPKSLYIDWQSVTGYLLADDVYLGRNWTFSLSIIHKAGRDSDFVAYAGWLWRANSKPSSLLGGEFLALPKHAPHKDLAIQLMSFLVSREIQTKIVRELSWPAMRLDAIGGVEDWQERYHRAINQALQHAEPVPDQWSKIEGIYKRMFTDIIDLNANIEKTLVSFQAEIDKLGIRQRQ